MSSIASARALRLLSQKSRCVRVVGKSRQQSSFVTTYNPMMSTSNLHQPTIPQLCNRSFSTNDVDTSDMSSAQLKTTALNFARQDNPMKAQLILEQLENQGSADENAKDLSDIRTSIIDAWIKQQNQMKINLQDSAANSDTLRVQEGYLEEVCQAAESASQIVESMNDPSAHHFVAILKGWANACEIAKSSGLTKSRFVRGIPQRAQHILSLQTDPTVESYNQVIKAWAHSGEHLRGTMAEQVFKQVEKPNGETFKQIIRAWCWSKERRCAFTATGHFMRMMKLLEIGQFDMEPTLEDYHVLFDSWTSAEDKNAPSKVQTVLQIAENAERMGLTTIGLDEKCYRDALITMARRVNVPEVGEIADETLHEMKSKMMIPDTVCYGSAIQAWKHVATARESEDREKAARRALSLLQEMTKAYHRTTAITVKPTTKNYNDVLEALTISRSTKTTQLAEELLLELEDSFGINRTLGLDSESTNQTFENSNVGPTAESYKLVLNIWRNSRSSDKVSSSIDVLQRMKKNLESIKATSSDQMIIEAFATFISVCANSGSKSAGYRKKAMALALRSVEDLKSLGFQPDPSIYVALIEAGNKLIGDGADRQRVLENIFQTACQEGRVDQNVLEQYKLVASSYSYAKLVVAHSKEVENMKVVPESWTRNVEGFLANTKDGRKVLPLSIDGTFTFTKAATEYKMRKLRRQENKKMLQGGRLK